MKLRMTLVEISQTDKRRRWLTFQPSNHAGGTPFVGELKIGVTVEAAAPFALFQDYAMEITSAPPEEPTT